MDRAARRDRRSIATSRRRRRGRPDLTITHQQWSNGLGIRIDDIHHPN
jgi:hypothetical protein